MTNIAHFTQATISISKLLIVLLLTSTTQSIFAAAITPEKHGSTSYQMTLASEYFLWEEYTDNSLLLYEQGIRVRVGGQAFYHSTHNKYGISAQAYLGRPDYTGQDQSGNQASSVVDYTGVAVNFITQSQHTRQLASHILLGTEYWQRNIHATTNELGQPVSGARETYTVIHSGIGLTIQTNSLEIDLTLKMPLRIYEYAAGFDTYLRPQNQPSVSASIKHDFNNNKSLYIRGYFDSTLLGRSACVGNFYDPIKSEYFCISQPESRAYITGIEIGRKL